MNHIQQTDLPTSLSEPSQLVSRFSIAILAVTLFGVGIGTNLPPEMGTIAFGGGATGLLAFAVFEWSAHSRQTHYIGRLRSRAEHRLTRALATPASDMKLLSDLLTSVEDSM